MEDDKIFEMLMIIINTPNYAVVVSIKLPSNSSRIYLTLIALYLERVAD